LELTIVVPFISSSQEIKWGIQIFGLFDRIEGACHPWSPAASKVPDSGIVATIRQQRRRNGGVSLAATAATRWRCLPGRDGGDFQLCGHLESVPNPVAISEIDVHSVLQNYNRILWCLTWLFGVQLARSAPFKFAGIGEHTWSSWTWCSWGLWSKSRLSLTHCWYSAMLNA
jgi:hypothetical protein